MAAVQAITSDTESDNRSSDFREYVSTGPNFEFETVQIANENSPTEFINAVSFEQISGGVEPFQGYIDMTADLPGIHPVSTSVNATYQLIRFISENSLSPKSEQPAADSPDVGYREGSFIQLCSV